jgi:hypothetical protein
MKMNNTSKTLALLLMLAFTTSAIVASPSASAHSPPWQVPTYAFLSVSPVTVGINQQSLLVMWLNTPPPTAQGPWGDRWHGYTVDITKPDGTKETLGPFVSDPIASYAVQYTPNQVGNYTFVFKFAGDIVTGQPYPPDYNPYTGYVGLGNQIFGYDNINDTYMGSQSDPVTLVVQQQPIQAYQETPLPTQFWERPIYGANRQWSAVAANWLDGAAQNVGPTERFGYGKGPESAHVMWTRPYWAGGVMDARYSDTAYYTGQSYEGFWTGLGGGGGAIILNGKLYYNVLTPPKYGWYCVDLYTGKTDYFHNTTGDILTWDVDWNAESGVIQVGALTFGQILDFESPNQHGGFPYLWSIPVSNWGYVPGPQSDWMMFDAFTGNYICSIANVTEAGTQVYGKDGSILYYNLAGTIDPSNPYAPAQPPFFLQVWNSTQAIHYESPWQGVDQWLWRPYLNRTFDGNNGYSLNVPIPDMSGASILTVRQDQYVIVGVPGRNNGTYSQEGWIGALNLDPSKGAVGQMLYNVTYTPPPGPPDTVNSGFYGGAYIVGPKVDPEDGVFVFRDILARTWLGYSLATGKQIWGPTPSEQSWGFYAGEGIAGDAQINDGKLLSAGYSGVLVAYDVKTGKTLWSFAAVPEGFESYYPYTPLWPGCIADGKIYLYSTEHSPSTPLRRDAFLWCVNLADGKLLWKMSNWGSGPSIADGYLVDLNLFDNQIYCWGKGPSATTVTAPDVAVQQGTNVVIKGKVTDQTPSAQAMGTPAISDADQEAWMEYLYQQRTMPTSATGVQVHVTAIDPNGNFQDLGTAVSNELGNYVVSWAPPVPGTYTVTATFAGSAAYYGSQAGTSFVVSTATSASQPTTNSSNEPVGMYIVAATIIIVVAITIVAVLILRKKA